MNSTVIIRKVISLAASLFILFNVTNNIKAQTSRHKFGLGISTTVGGCGFGAIYNPSAHYYYGPFKMELAASIQKRKLNLTGAQFTFEYAIFDGCNKKADKLCFDGTQVYLFTSSNYNRGAYLGKSQLKTEKRVADDTQVNFEELRFESLDITIGFGSRIQLTKKIKWVNSIGISAWQTIKGERATYREYASLGLKLRSGLTYDF